MNRQTNRKAHLIPFPVIEAASSGDAEAIGAVLNHYSGYIATLATRRLYDEYGCPRMCVDEALRRRLECKLIAKILTFNVA